MLRLPVLAILLLAMAALVGASAGAAPATGELHGVVLDETGLAVPLARITLSAPELVGGSQQRTSDAGGAFRFEGLPPDTYTLLAQKVGLAMVVSPTVRVFAGRRTDVTIEMVPSVVRRQLPVIRLEPRLEPRSVPEGLRGIPRGRSFDGDEVLPPGAIESFGARPPGVGGSVASPFHDVSVTPRATIPLDVDTASYVNVRHLLGEGTWPPRGAVRIEELLAHFPFVYEPPAGDAPFAVHAEVASSPWAEGRRIVRVGVRARDVPTVAPPPRNLVFLVDVSGSMQRPDRLPLVQEALILLAGQLGPADSLALVMYSGTAGVVLAPTPGDRRADIRYAIGRLGAGGTIAESLGIRTAYQFATDNFQENGLNRVVLATDEDLGPGTASQAELLSLVAGHAASGVSLSVLAVGRGTLRDVKMELLADTGAGSCVYLTGLADARRFLSEELAAPVATVAWDVAIEVEFDPSTVSHHRRLGYEGRSRDPRAALDDVHAGQSITALYEIVPATSPGSPPAAPLLHVRIRHGQPDGVGSSELSFPVRDTGLAFADASTDTRWAAAVAGFGMLLRDSPDRGTLDWEWVGETARGALGEDAGGHRAELLGLVEEARRIRSER